MRGSLDGRYADQAATLEKQLTIADLSQFTPKNQERRSAMRICVRMLPLVVVMLLLAACKSPPLELYATRQADMREDNAPRLRVFESGEQPAIVVDIPKGSGWGEKAGTVWVDEAISGRTVWSQSQFMREGYTHYFVPGGLRRGTYVVTLRAEGEARASINFDVQ